MQNVKTKIYETWLKLTALLRSGTSRLLDTAFMRKVIYIISWIPNWMGEHITYKKRKIIWGIVFLIPLVIGLMYFFVIPLITTIVYSFSFVENVTGEGLKVRPVGFRNYKYIFTEAASIRYGTFNELIVKSLVSIIADIPVIVIFSLIIAVILNTKFKGRGFARAIFFMPVIFNSQAIDLALTAARILDSAAVGATSELFASMFNFEAFLAASQLPAFLVRFLISAVHKIQEIVNYSGVQILIFLAAIQSVPKSLYEAAQMEGATGYEMFWKITFPLVSPMILTAAVYTVVDTFLRSPILKVITQYDNPKKSLSPVLGELSNYGIASAMGVIFSLSSAVIVIIVMAVLSKMVFYYDERK